MTSREKIIGAAKEHGWEAIDYGEGRLVYRRRVTFQGPNAWVDVTFTGSGRVSMAYYGIGGANDKIYGGTDAIIRKIRSQGVGW